MLFQTTYTLEHEDAKTAAEDYAAIMELVEQRRKSRAEAEALKQRFHGLDQALEQHALKPKNRNG